jgi:hypothetical protein
MAHKHKGSLIRKLVLRNLYKKAKRQNKTKFVGCFTYIRFPILRHGTTVIQGGYLYLDTLHCCAMKRGE